MSTENYGKLYNANYYKAYGSVGQQMDYSDKEYWNHAFEWIADNIIAIFHPKTFLDVGCAFGYLVAALRDKGVEAYGVDVSEYAISQAREDIRKYCFVQNVVDGLPEELPDHFDVVSTIEVIEHLHEEDCQAFLHNICSVTDTVLFSSTPDDYTEPTHFNVQQREYWVKRFAKEGFRDALQYDCNFISIQAIAFERGIKDIIPTIEEYERYIRLRRGEHYKLYDDHQKLQAEHKQLEASLATAENEKASLEASLESALNQKSELETEQQLLATDLENLQNEKDKLSEESRQLEKKLHEVQKEKERLEAEEAEHKQLEASLATAENEKASLEADNVLLRQTLESVEKSASYKITKPLRAMKRGLNNFTEKFVVLHKIKRAWGFFKQGGFKAVFDKMEANRKGRKALKEYAKLTGQSYEDLLNQNNRDGYVPYDSEYQDNQDFSGYTTDIKALAIYLPQYHSFPENDAWWGKGFTEWDNVKKGEVRFDGHYQPRVPHKDIGYYHLDNIETLRKQAILAKQHGIYGFCFYYYWFSGKRLMEKPVDMLLEHPEIDIPFCLCWANENWTRAWDGRNKDVLIGQEYSEHDDDTFILDMKKYIDDERYIKIDGKPIIMVYNPGQIPDCRKSFNRWREVARECGIGEILIWTMQTANYDATLLKITDCIDAEVDFPPHNMWVDSLGIRDIDLHGKSAFIYNYQKLEEYCAKKYETEKPPVPIHHCFMLAWDNAARRKDGWFTYYAFSLKSLYKWVLAIMKKTRKDFKEEERFIFVNAWNEWGEGTYLEPDEKYGYANINTVSKALFELPFNNDLKIIDKESPEVEAEEFEKTDGLSRIAVQLHMFYIDSIDEMIERVNQIPFNFDCYISTDTEEKKKEIEAAFNEKCKCKKLEVLVIPNRGRDVAPFNEQIGPVIDQYDYIGHFHAKKTATNVHGNEWKEYIFDHMFGSSEYLKRLFSIFEKQQNIGIIMPETYPVLEYQNEWGGNKPGVETILQRTGCEQDLPEAPTFPVGNMFWMRAKAVRPMFTSGIKQSDFPEEAGQVNLTIAHQIERSWVYIARAQGYGYVRAFNNMPAEGELENKKRLGIFVHFDKRNIISEADVETIRRMKKVLTDVVFISNSSLPEAELKKVQDLTITAETRENQGLDFAAWKYELEKLGREKVEQYDEVVLFNNSFFPPVFDVQNMFLKMQGKDLDFWGNTIFPYSPDGSYIHRDCIPEHIQSYFMVFRKKVITSDTFWNFWDNMPENKEYIDVIANCESQFTKILSDAGFKYEPYIKESYYLSQFLNNYRIPYEKPTSLLLLKSTFVKKKCYQYMNDEERTKLEWLCNNMDQEHHSYVKN